MNRLKSWTGAAPDADPLEIALAEIDVAILLVRGGQARRVRLCGLSAGQDAAGLGLAWAQAARVRFVLERGALPSAAVSLLIGPAIDD
jgi:hypothetical protein